MKEEYISISEFAKRAGVSRQAIYSRLNSDLSTFVDTVNGKKSLNVRALQLFDNSKTDKEVYSSELFSTLKKNNELLTKELEFKNREIEQLREENKRLSEQLLALSDKVGMTLQTITQTQLADRLIEGKKIKDSIDEPIEPIQKKKWWQFRRK